MVPRDDVSENQPDQLLRLSITIIGLPPLVSRLGLPLSREENATHMTKREDAQWKKGKSSGLSARKINGRLRPTYSRRSHFLIGKNEEVSFYGE